MKGNLSCSGYCASVVTNSNPFSLYLMLLVVPRTGTSVRVHFTSTWYYSPTATCNLYLFLWGQVCLASYWNSRHGLSLCRNVFQLRHPLKCWPEPGLSTDMRFLISCRLRGIVFASLRFLIWHKFPNKFYIHHFVSSISVL